MTTKQLNSFIIYITVSDFQSFIGMITRDEVQCICTKRLVQILRPVAEPKVWRSKQTFFRKEFGFIVQRLYMQ